MSPRLVGLRKWVIASTIIISTVALCSLTAVVLAAEKAADKSEWKAPARAARKKNPVEPAKSSLDAGKKVYAAECADCHGPRGAGDGPGARELKEPIPSLADARVWGQTDGELFWKVSTGRGDMPGFDDMLEEEDRWHVVNYLRSAFGTKAQARKGDDGASQASASRGKAE
jgi:mono/diheme cytochrome c family protein